MSYKPIRTLSDAFRHGLKLRVTCKRCRRQVIYSPGDLIGVDRRYALAPMDRLAARFVCRPPEGCSARGPTLTFILWPEIEPRPDPPKPIQVDTPKGVDPDAWANADAGERAKILRRARG